MHPEMEMLRCAVVRGGTNHALAYPQFRDALTAAARQLHLR
jgi:hypothetical protein